MLPTSSTTERNPGVLPATAPDPALARFASQIFRLQNHAPSTGLGKFDVEYVPAKGEVVARLNLEVFFEISRDTPSWERPWPWQEENGWTDAEEQQYVADMKATIESGWNASPVPIRCVKPGWEQFVAMPRIEVNVFAEDTGSCSPHYQITVCKGGHSGPGNHRPGVGAPWLGMPGQMDMDEDQIRDQVLGCEAQEAELERLKAALPTVSFVRIGTQWALSAEGSAALDRFAKVSADTMPSMHKPRITAYGWNCIDPVDAADNKHCGSLLKARLTEGGAKHEIAIARGGDHERGVMGLEIAPWDQDVQKWPVAQYNMLLHEVGHMLGLNDEYAIADDEGHGMTPSQERLVRASGADAHPVDSNTTSVLSQGKDVLPAHYVTLWEALGKMTKAFLEPKDWRL